MAELEDVFEVGFQTKLTGGLVPIFLEADTDLNDVRTPNFYTGQNVSNFNYGNCPLTSGTFSLEVVSMGADGQVKQKLVYCHKTLSITWERIYYGEAWGEWVKVSDFGNSLLWSGGYYMTAGHTINLSEPISKQASGIVLVFSPYENGEKINNDFVSHFVAKKLIAEHSGSGHTFINTKADFVNISTKHLYIYNDKIVGFDNNGNSTLVSSGITFENNKWVLRYVIGV